MTVGSPILRGVVDPFDEAGASVSDTTIFLKPSGGDDTSAIIAAMASIPSTGARLVLGSGLWNVGGIGALFALSIKGTHVVGAGEFATMFNVIPAGDVDVFTMSAGASILYGCSIEGISFTSADTSFLKRAIVMKDTSGCRVERCTVGPIGSWNKTSAKTSVCLQIYGRDLGTVRDNSWAGDRPIVISANPNSFIDLDLWEFSNNIVYPASGGNGIEIEDCYLSNSRFVRTSCNGGANGIKASGTLSQTSTNIEVDDLRHEQGTSATGRAIDWSLATTRNISFRHVTAGTPGRGIRVQNATHVTIANLEYDFTGIAADISTCDLVFMQNNFAQASSSIVTTGMVNVITLGQQASIPAMRPFEYWISAANGNAMNAPVSILDEFRATAFTGGVTVLANDAATILVPGLGGNTVFGRLTLVFSGAGDGAADFNFSATALYPIGGAANLPANIVIGLPAANHVGVVFNSAGSIGIHNDYAANITARISVQYFF